MIQRIAAMRVLVAIDNQPSSRATVDALVKMHWYEGTEIALVTVLAQNEEAAGPGEALRQAPLAEPDPQRGSGPLPGRLPRRGEDDQGGEAAGVGGAELPSIGPRHSDPPL